MVNKTGLSILISIILTIILVSVVNVGTSLFLTEPKYSDYCNYNKFPHNLENITQEICEGNEGVWHETSYCNNEKCVDLVSDGNCDFYEKCQQDYDTASKPYNQKRFYIFAGIGFILLLVGLFALESLIQITGLSTGGILVFEGIVQNWQNKTIVFIALLGILVIFGILARRVINKTHSPKKNSKKTSKKKA